MTTARYIAPSRGDRLFNAVVGWLTRRGISLAGSRVLAVRGRTSGEWRTTVVNLLTVGERRYLVAPRGTTQWVRNLRAAGEGELRVGRRTEAFTADELADEDKLSVLRAYLGRWGWEVGRFFEGDGNAAARSFFGANFQGMPVLERVAYDYANAHLGLDFGYKRVTFYIHGGMSYIRAQIHNLDSVVATTASENGGNGSTEISIKQDPTVTAWVPSAKLGLIVYLW